VARIARSDLGAGKFDGASLVQNFENLNPANTFWDKYYQVFANVDTDAQRFLDFERWWGGYFLMNREEIEWITQNLFVGNKLWSGRQVETAAFDLREIKVRSCCSPRWATTSRRRSRRSTGWPTSTARPRRSRRAGR
jgi:poly(3-hydroxyalkanoate) synthetase